MRLTRADVATAVRERFPNSDAAAIVGVLDLYGTEAHEHERERVQLAIIALSEGSEGKLRYFVDAAKKDYRDVLCWVETGPLSEAEGARVREAAHRLIENWGTGKTGN